MTRFPDKTEMRHAVRTARAAFVDALDPQSRALAFRVAPTPLRALIDTAGCVAAYLPVGAEADPSAFLAYAASTDKRTVLPFVAGQAVPMRFLLWTAGDPLVAGPLGLMQPDRARAAEADPDLILAPLLGFDRRLHRLGQGAAFYDRAFARFPDALRVGIAWSAQEVEFVPDDPWDVPLDAVLTEREWIARDRNGG